MADAFTVNTTPSMGNWDIVDGYSADISTTQALLATSTAHNYLVKSITLILKDTDGKWVKILNDTTLAVGPFKPYNRLWHVEYESPMIFTGGVYVTTETDRPIHITMCYRKFPII